MPRPVPAALLLICLAASPARAEVPLVGLDLAPLDEATFVRLDAVGLEKRIVVRLVQEGFAVAPLEGAPGIRLSLRAIGGALQLRSQCRGEVFESAVLAGGAASGELHFEVAQKLVQLARRCLAPAESPAPPTVVPAPPPAAHQTVERPPRFGVAAAIVGLARKGGLDPAASVDAHVDLSPVRLHLVPELAFASAPEVTVREWQLAVGAGWPLARGSFEVEPLVVAGCLAHQFALRSAQAKDRSGVAWDPLAAAGIQVGWRAPLGVQVGLRLLGGLSRGREHRWGETQLWARGPGRFEAGMWAGAHF